MLFRYKYLSIIWVCVILILTFTPGPNIPPLPQWDLISFDTFVHAFIFAVLVFLLANSFKRSELNNWLHYYPVVSSIVISIFFGCLIEITQPFVPGRTFDYYDILSNTIGCLLGCLLYYLQQLLKPTH